MLCWVDLYRGIIVCDLFDEIPQLRYVSLPVDAPAAKFDNGRGDYSINPRMCPRQKRSFWVSDNGGELRFLDVSPRCCCGDLGATTCNNARNAFVISSWTLKMNDMRWVMDAMVDATELWSLDAYTGHGLPRVRPEYPLMIMDDPRLVFFVVQEEYQPEISFSDRGKWRVMFDMRSKKILSVSQYDESDTSWQPYSWLTYFPSKISNYFTSIGACSNVAKRPLIVTDKPAVSCIVSSNSLRSSSSRESSTKHSQMSKGVVASPEEILAALEEVPELDCDDMLRAYSILCDDIGRHRFRSLLGLPVSLRKKWLLIEIKSSEDCSICSLCTANMQRG
ncbi:Os11g0174700 [Oryza sativa Japonica Group]|uniref:Os11g0174700 protein n=2 Tax=Oryza sativa subsp. japonica TaxID=39947 RepID=A0A0P0XZT3_ORYSJ|nr:Os11g0174700 [Oryza sativa Japonica Group]